MKFPVVAISAILIGALAVSSAPAPKKAATKKRGNSGVATWFTQNGNAGSCGHYHKDSDKVVAVAPSLSGKHCGQSVTIQHGGKKVNAVVADTCPECDYGHLDLSTGAFKSLASMETGEIDINWWFN